MDMNFAWTTRAEKLLVVAYWWKEQEGKCCICHKAMEPYKRQSSHKPQAATVEHLIPRRDGGPNTAGNVRLAHALCNNTLGALWVQNRHRAANGLPLITPEQALRRETPKMDAPRKRSIVFRRGDVYPPESPYYNLWKAWVDEQEAKRLRGIACKRVSLPRGATLLPEYQEKIGCHLKARSARKMTAVETARWLAEQGIRGA